MDIGSFRFDGLALPNRLVSHTLDAGDLQGSTILGALTDQRLTTYIDPDWVGDYVVLGFPGSGVRNDTGFDVAIFELWAAEAIRVSLTEFGAGISFMPEYTGYRTTFSNGETARVNVVWLDLSALGVQDGESVSQLVIGATGDGETTVNNTSSSPEIAAVGAIRSIPEPSTLGLLGVSLAALLWGGRRRLR
jgi:hypothetical protein